MPHLMGNRMAIPVAKMLTVDQHASEIRHFLAKVIDFSNAHAIQFKPKKVECDMFWAILQGTTAAFNGIDIKSYLQWCFEVHAKKKTTREIQGKTIVHCSAAHMLRTFLRHMESTAKNIKQFFMYTITLMINQTTLAALTQTFSDLVTVLNSRYSSGTVQKHKL